MTDTATETQLDQILALVGGKAKLARIVHRHGAVVTRMTKTGKVPWHFNESLRAWAKDNDMSEKVEPLLEWQCPCCGRGETPGIDKASRTK